jgi:multiple sugar transport system substrate-binding protein
MTSTDSRIRIGITRRAALKGIGGAGIAGVAGSGLISLGAKSAGAATTTIISWAGAGQRWEFAQKGIYPLYQKKHPDIEVTIVTDPIGDILAKVAIEMSTKTDRYDVICEDYNYMPQLIAEGACLNIEPYLAKDAAYKADILSDIPENILDLYRDKPLKQRGQLYGLPNDANCQMQYYRADIFQKFGVKPAETWDDVLEIARVISDNGKNKVLGTTMRRGFFAAASFITLLRSYGGDWFDKMEPGGWKVTLDTDEGHKAFDMLMKMNQFLEPTSLNASDDEANAGMLNGAWQYAPAEWGGSSMNDPKFTKFASDWQVTKCPKGTGPKGRSAGHMGGLGFFIPTYSKHHDEAWEWIKFACSGDKQDPEIGKADVENTGQPARLSLLSEYTNIRPYFKGLAESLPVAARFPPIPESGSNYELVGNEVSAAVTGQKSPDRALKDMQAAVTKAMTKAGYYK